MTQTFNLRPVEQLILQGTPFCNLNCTYCDLSIQSRRKTTKMPLELVTSLLDQLISQRLIASKLVVVWHSGEPLTLPPEYYKNAIEIIQKKIKESHIDVSVSFDFQTNATLINDAWCDFFEKNSEVINLGVSCDGPEYMHNAFRVDWQNRSTFDRTIQGMEKLESRGIPYNLIAVVSKTTLSKPDEFFNFFLSRRKVVTDFHFNVLASPIDGYQALNYEKNDRDLYYLFYRRLFDLWLKSDADGKSLPIRNFSQVIKRLSSHNLTEAHNYLEETSAPLRSLNMDAKGNITTFYAGLDIETHADRYGDNFGFGLGNINDLSLIEMLNSSKFKQITKDFASCQKHCAASCEYYSLCPGGFELIQLSKNASDQHTPETVECFIHVKALTEAVLDGIQATQQ